MGPGTNTILEFDFCSICQKDISTLLQPKKIANFSKSVITYQTKYKACVFSQLLERIVPGRRFLAVAR